MAQKKPRWTATITYKTKKGTVDVVHSFEELQELHDIVEKGPDFHCIVSITTKYNHASKPRTLEESLAA